MVSPELMGIALSLICSMLATAVCYGSLKQKVNDIEASLKKHTEDDAAVHRSIVTLDLFRATISPLQDDIRELKNDVKILISRGK